MLQLATTTTTNSDRPEVTYSLEPLHEGRPVHGVRFASDGNLLATCGFDGSVHFWRVEEEESEQGGGWDIALESALPLSKRPILQVDFTPKQTNAVLAAGADGAVHCVDLETLKRKTSLLGHESYVNGVCAMGENAALSCSEDCTARIWDLNSNSSLTLSLPHEATSVAWTRHSPNQVFCGSLDNAIRCFDRRKPAAPVYQLLGNKDTVTGLALIPTNGRELLSVALDGAICIWDVSPFCASPTRLTKQLPHGSSNSTNMLRASYSADGKHFSAGSGPGTECTVCLWDCKGTPYKALRGHSQAVIEVAFHPTRNLLASCGMDGKVLVGTW